MRSKQAGNWIHKETNLSVYFVSFLRDTEPRFKEVKVFQIQEHKALI
jgi:hypothetical protein